MLPQQQPPGWYPDPRGGRGQGYWDGQQWQFPPAKRRSSRLIVIAILFGVIVAGIGILWMSAVGQHALQKSQSTQGSDQSAAAAPQQPTQVKLNQEARDGNLSFVVTAVDTAQQTATVHLTVKNVGNRPTVFWADNQRLWIGDKWFVPDKAAASKDGASSVKLDPGKSSDVVLSFGVPTGSAGVDHVELHDASVSAGVKVEPRS